jgi:predicted negative regulator of RcsB-dependent stress response
MTTTSDKEQIQMLKDWWKQYGSSILFALFALVVINFGWRYWQQYKHRRADYASITYTQMLVAAEQHKDDEAKLYADRLIKHYKKSAYAGLAALMQSKLAVKKGDFKLALEPLQFVIKNSSDNALRQLARIRAARILIETKQPQKAIDMLAITDDDAYLAEISEIQGDALLKLGKTTEAKQAYQKAKTTSVGDAEPPLLQLKMQQL